MHLAKVRDHRFAPVEHRFDVRDTILYALGLGFGADPVDPAELPFVYEDGLKAVPSICVILAHPGFWAKQPEFGIDWVRILHGEQSFEIHRPIPAAGVVHGEYEIEAVEDKGAGKAAVLHQVKRLRDASGCLLATVRSVLFLRGDGGSGSFGTPPAAPAPLPDGTPDALVDLSTLPQQALIYRLSGDYNPIHADPAPARAAGFDRPILHGLCTMGIATRALLRARAGNDPARLTAMAVRFSKPVFPGETIITEIFDQDDGGVRFRCRSKERDVVVLDRGHAAITG